jgi:crotonobetainyl-CoA:carnitine CoA-transferase CaiB-like acyl-CoA transferase
VARPARTDPPLAGLRVVDLSGGVSGAIAGAYCAKLLADAGADVVKVEPPGGDPAREEHALFDHLHASVRSVTVDPADAGDAAFLAALVGRADLIVGGHRAEIEQWLARDVASLRAAQPRLGIVAISWFGSDGPWNDRPATEFTIQGWAGSTGNRGRRQGAPLSVGGRLGEWATGAVAGVAAMAVLHGVRRAGEGAFVDVSVLEAATLVFDQMQAVAAQMDGRGPEPDPISWVVDVPSVEPTKDGWVGFATNGSAHFAAFAEMVGHPEWIGHPEYGRVDRRPEHDRELRPLIAEYTTAHTTDEILATAAEMRIPVAPVGNGATLPAIPPFVERGVFARSADGTMVQPRVPYTIEGVTPRPFGHAPAAGEHTAEVRAALDAPVSPSPATDVPASVRGSAASAARPFDGLRVFDFTSYWAGPYASQILGFLGADVVKVESVQRPDGTRMGTAYASVGDRPWELAPLFHAANTCKREITLDFTRDEGIAVGKRLLETCDVLIENYVPRVLDRFGLIDDAVRQQNPGLMVVRMPAWGLDGIWRDRPGFAQSMEQVTGLAWVTGNADDAPVVPRGPCDPLGGLHATFALLVAMIERDATGRGAQIEASLVEAAINVAAEQVAVHSREGKLLGRDGNHGRFAEPQNVYLTADGAHWLALAIETDEQWRSLRRVLGGALGDPEWGADPALDTAAGRRAQRDGVDARLAETFAALERDDAVARLWDAGVPVAPVVNPRRVYENPQLDARGFFEPVTHDVAGTVRIPGFPARWDVRTEPWHTRPAPMLGEHNAEILTDLGYTADEIAALEASEIIGTSPVT